MQWFAIIVICCVSFHFSFVSFLSANNATRTKNIAGTRSTVLKSSLSVSSEIIEAVSELNEILDVLASSIGAVHDNEEEEEEEEKKNKGADTSSTDERRKISVAMVLQGYTEPITRSAVLSAKGLSALDTSALMLNTCSYLQRALAPYPFTAQRIQSIADEMDVWLATLVREHTATMLSRCNFGAILNAISESSESGSLLNESNESLSPAALRGAMEKFYSILTILAVCYFFFYLPQYYIFFYLPQYYIFSIYLPKL